LRVGVADGSVPEDLWHLTIDDLLVAPNNAVRVEGTGPFVVTLSASNSPPSLPPRGLLKFEHLHVYQVQYRENGQLRFRLRLGPIATELEADVVLAAVREHYPRAWMSTADEDDLRALEHAATRGPKSRAPVEVVAAPQAASVRVSKPAEPPKLTDTVTLGVPRKKARPAPTPEPRAEAPPPAPPKAPESSAPAMSIRDLAAAVLAPSPEPAPRVAEKPSVAPKAAAPAEFSASTFAADASPAREMAMRRALATIRPGQKLPAREIAPPAAPLQPSVTAPVAAAPAPPAAPVAKSEAPTPRVAPGVELPAKVSAAPVATRPVAARPTPIERAVAAPVAAPVVAPIPVPVATPAASTPIAKAPASIEFYDAYAAATTPVTATLKPAPGAAPAAESAPAPVAPLWIEFTETPPESLKPLAKKAAPSAETPVAPPPLWIEFTEEPAEDFDIEAIESLAPSATVEAPAALAPLWIEFTDAPSPAVAPSVASPPPAESAKARASQKQPMPVRSPAPTLAAPEQEAERLARISITGIVAVPRAAVTKPVATVPRPASPVTPASPVAKKAVAVEKPAALEKARAAPATPASPVVKKAVVVETPLPIGGARAAPAIAATPSAQKAAIVEKPTAIGKAPAVEEKAIPALDQTMTMRALTPLELADSSTSRLFVVQLALSESEFTPENVPSLGIFAEYRLYSAMGLDGERVMHALRLGFFTDAASAEAVAGYLRTHFDAAAVKRVSEAERERFADRRVTASKDAGATGVHAAIELSSPDLTPTTRLSDLTKRSKGRS
jgi:hypothetical protein